jgi:spore maturation protein CgeB
MCDVPIHYLPHSFDPARHYPHRVNGEYKTDIFFYGTLWPERKELIDQLDLSAYNASVGLALFNRTAGDEMPRVIDNDDMVLWYSGTKIALNHHRTVMIGGTEHVQNPYSLGPRAFEIAACGAFQLCDDARPELRDVFGDSVATYSDVDDLQGKIDYYLSHDAERRAMRMEALERVRPCSFLNRAREIVMPALEQLI